MFIVISEQIGDPKWRFFALHLGCWLYGDRSRRFVALMFVIVRPVFSSYLLVLSRANEIVHNELATDAAGVFWGRTVRENGNLRRSICLRVFFHATWLMQAFSRPYTTLIVVPLRHVRGSGSCIDRARSRELSVILTTVAHRAYRGGVAFVLWMSLFGACLPARSWTSSPTRRSARLCRSLC